MEWDGQERRSGKDKRKTERRSPSSQAVTATTGATNQRKHMRRANDRDKVKEILISELMENDRWRDLRTRTIDKLAKETKIQRPSLRLIHGGNRD